MSEDEAEDFVVRLLRTRGALTTMEIETTTAREGRRCPDQTVVFLTKMRGKGLIDGEVSIEKRGWIWRLPLAGTDTQTPPG
jgi:imidazolonepropionase-like amidohydrolase